MKGFKPSEVVIKRKREANKIYNPSSFLRFNNGALEQMWWENNGTGVWETIPKGESLKDISLGKHRKKG